MEALDYIGSQSTWSPRGVISPSTLTQHVLFMFCKSPSSSCITTPLSIVGLSRTKKVEVCLSNWPIHNYTIESREECPVALITSSGFFTDAMMSRLLDATGCSGDKSKQM